MSGPNAESKGIKFLLIIALLLPFMAEARSRDLTSTSIFGLGLGIGVESNPTSDFISTPQTTSSSFSHYFSLQPSFDFYNFVLRLSATLHSVPLLKGSGADATNGVFTERSNSSTFVYGAQILFVPYYFGKGTSRFFIGLGIGTGSTTLKDDRFYSNSVHRSEILKGSAQELSASVGSEIVFIQNYSLQIEGGYRMLAFSNLKYNSAGDLTGTSRSKGEVAKLNGINKKFDLSGYFIGVGLNLHF